MQTDQPMLSTRIPGRPWTGRGWIAPIVLLLIVNVWLVTIAIYPPAVVRSIAPSAMKPEIGRAYVVAEPFKSYFYELPSDGLSGNKSRLRLFEDGEELAGQHAPHTDVRESGSGRYSHWRESIWFTSSDNTDPRTNGRRYEISSPTQVRTSLVLAVASLDVLALALIRRKLKRRFGRSSLADATPLHRPLPFWLLSALAIGVVGVVAGVAVTSHLEYRTNDDVNMRFIAESVVGDSSTSAFLYYQNILVGLTLRTLYNFAPRWPWYDINVFGAAVTGGLLCVAGMLKLSRSWAERAGVCAIAIFVTIPMLQAVQFSASAMLLAAGAIVAFCVILFERPQNKALANGWIAAAFLAFLWGSLIRFEAAMLVVLAGALPLLLFGWRRLGKREIGLVSAAAVSVALASAAAAYNANFYSTSPGWEMFMQHKLTFVRATEWLPLDTSRPQLVDAALRAAGWSPNDYELLRGWLAGNEKLFSLERMKQFIELAPRMSIEQLANGMYLQVVHLQNEFWLILCLPFVAAFLIGTPRGFVVSSVSLMWLIGMSAATAVTFKIGFGHIMWALYASTLLTVNALILAMPRRSERSTYEQAEQAIVRTAAVAGLMLLAIWQVNSVVTAGLAAERFRTGPLAQDLGAWSLKASELVVVWNNNFPFEFWPRPFGKTDSAARQFFHTTSNAYSPLVAGLYRQWGTSDIAWAMCHVPGVYRVEDMRRGYANAHERQLATYMKEHYGEAVRVEEVFAGQVLRLYACHLTR